MSLRKNCLLALLMAIVIAWTSACSDWETVKTAPTPATTFDTTRIYRITLTDSEQKLATHLRVTGDSLIWREWVRDWESWEPAKQHRTPIADVQQIEVQSANKGGEVVVGLGMIAITAARVVVVSKK